VFFIACGLAVAGAWGVLCTVTGTPSQEPSRPAIKLVMGSNPISAESEMSWGSLETKRFSEYCRRRGWGDIDVTVTTAVGDYFQKYIASTVAGEGADVIMVGPTDVVYFADHDLIEPLDEYIENWDAYRHGHISEEVLEMCRGTDGKVLGFPFAQLGPMFFAIRRDWLDNLGLEAPDTFEEAYGVWRAFTFDDPDGNGKDDTHGYAISMKTEGGDHVWRMTPRETVRTIIIHALLILACATMILPFLVVLTASLKCPALGDEMTVRDPDFIPKRFHWQNYLLAWRAGKLARAFGNSLMVSVVWTLGTVMVSAMAAYSIGRRQCFGHQWILLFFLSSMMFAGQTTIIPRFILYRALGLYDSLLIFMIPGTGAFTIYLLSHWFKNVPKEIEEAALIDGCSEWSIFFRIILPLSLPALATVGLFAFMGSWNNFVGPYVFLESESKMTVPLAIQMFPVRSGTFEAAKAAAVTISVVPAIVVFVFLQRWFLKGLSLGALKG